MTLATLAPPKPARPSANRDWLRALELTGRLESEPQRTLPAVIDELALRQPDAPALLADRERFTFAQLAERAHRYARWALDQELRKGDVVALMMPNRPEYLAVWLGLSRIGVTTALINTQLRGASLVHCLKVAGAKRIIVDASLEAALSPVLTQLDRREPWTAWRGPNRLAADRPGDRGLCACCACRHGTAGRHASPTARCSSTPPAPPACRRPPTSAITG